MTCYSVHVYNTHTKVNNHKNKFHKNPLENPWIGLSVMFCSIVLPKVLPMTCSKGWMIFHYPSLS